MPEILTESFCERCGTRYTFESAAPRKTRRLGQIKTLSKGMKNWVMSDDTSMDEAMAAARNDEDREITSQQLDAFHATFNFCMTCRQYTCGNCWNAAEGKCLTCAPHLGHEILPAPFADQGAFEPVRIEAEAWPEVDLSAAGSNGHGNGFHPAAADAWTGSGTTDADDIPGFDPAARLAFLSGETPLPVVEPDEAPATASPTEEWPTSWLAPTETSTDEPLPIVNEPAAAGSSDSWPDADHPVADDPTASAKTAEDAIHVDASSTAANEPPPSEEWAGVGATRTADLLRRFRPGQNIDAELAAYEAELALTTEPAVESAAQIAESVAETPPVVEPMAEAVAMAELAPEPEPVAAAPEPEPEPLAAEPEPEPAAAEPEPVAAAPEPEPIAAELPREDRIQQPTWQIFAPEATPAGGRPLDGAVPPAAPAQPPFAAAADPQWPVQPDMAESPAMALLANRARGSQSDALWAASAREVLAPPASVPAVGVTTGVQPCSSCGLSLSATARFCRRCGTRQG